jgi:hypothetical protein
MSPATKPHLDLHGKCPIFVSDCNEIWMYLTDFRNNSQYQYIIHADRQTDGHDEAKMLFLLLGIRVWKAWCNYYKFEDVILRLSILWRVSSVAKSGYYLRHVPPTVHIYQRSCHRMYFLEILYLELLWESVGKIQILSSGEDIGYCTWRYRALYMKTSGTVHEDTGHCTWRHGALYMKTSGTVHEDTVHEEIWHCTWRHRALYMKTPGTVREDIGHCTWRYRALYMKISGTVREDIGHCTWRYRALYVKPEVYFIVPGYIKCHRSALFNSDVISVSPFFLWFFLLPVRPSSSCISTPPPDRFEYCLLLATRPKNHR